MSQSIERPPIMKKWLSVFDKTKEKDGKTPAVYRVFTYLRHNDGLLDTWQAVLQGCLDNIEAGRFWVTTGYEVEPE